MFWKPLEVLLTPRQIVVFRRLPGSARDGGRAVVREPVTSPSGGAAWQEAVNVFAKVMAGAGKNGTRRVRLALSDVWVRIDLTSIGAVSLSEYEMLVLGRTHLAEQFPDAGPDGLSIRIARQESRLVTAGIETRLLGSLKDAAASAGLRLKRVEPLFAWVHDQYQKQLRGVCGWMILVEPGIITAALMERGRLTSLHAQRCEGGEGQAVMRLLERQNALLAQPCLDVCAFSAGTGDLNLPAPWRMLWQRRIIDFDAADASMSDTAAA